MFVVHTAVVEAGIAEVEHAIQSLRSEMGSWADLAYREGEQLRARVGPTRAIAREVELEIGTPEIQGRGLFYPVRWTAQSAALLFPELDADLVLESTGLHRTAITLQGNYKPPLGTLGRLADRAGLRKVAEMTVANWVERLTAALSREVRPA